MDSKIRENRPRLYHQRDGPAGVEGAAGVANEIAARLNSAIDILLDLATTIILEDNVIIIPW